LSEQRHRAIRPAVFAGFIFATFVLVSTGAVGGVPGIWRTDRTVEKDGRVTKDRLRSQNNLHHEDDAFLNAVGAVWPYGIHESATGYGAATGHDAATGFLIDRCHVLTNMHVVYPDYVVVHPPVGRSVAFAVGQTESDRDRGALQGLKFLLQGVVIAHGDAVIVDHRVHDPDNDWALIRLAADVDVIITPMSIAAIDPARLPTHFTLSAAGFPTDHRSLRGDGFKLKDLWGSDGRVVGIVSVSTAGAFIETTIQTTPGNSGGPIYGDFAGRKHLVVGMVQGIRGNGVDVSEDAPNIQVLFTSSTVAKITEAEAQAPCRAN
jgi:V8-like Glu-specific endopeptidase